MFTIQEKMKVLKGRKMVYVGDGNNMAHSLMYACAKVGMNMVCACPKGYQPDPHVLAEAQEDAAHAGCTITVEEDVMKAVKGADVLYIDTGQVWVKKKNTTPQKSSLLIKSTQNFGAARPEAIVMHCLPAYRGEEITDDVIRILNLLYLIAESL